MKIPLSKVSIHFYLKLKYKITTIKLIKCLKCVISITLWDVSLYMESNFLLSLFNYLFENRLFYLWGRSETYNNKRLRDILLILTFLLFVESKYFYLISFIDRFLSPTLEWMIRSFQNNNNNTNTIKTLSNVVAFGNHYLTLHQIFFYL